MSVTPEPHTRADKRLYRPAVDASAMSGRCWCSTATLSGAAGDIVVLRVAGEVDDGSFAGLDAALDDVLDRRPDHLIVDLAGLVSCSSRGITAIARTARAATANGTRYRLSGATPLFARLWAHHWPDGDAPPIHRTAAAAVLSAIMLQADLPTAVSGQAHPDSDERDPDRRPVDIREDVDDAYPAVLTRDDHPRPDAHDADPSARRRALHRHRSTVYRNTLNALGASYGAHSLAPDLDAQLRIALARFAATPPDDQGDGLPGAP